MTKKVIIQICQRSYHFISILGKEPQTYQNAHAYKSKRKNVICYFANWAQLRTSSGKFVPENIDARPCSHIFYAFANLDSISFEVVPGNPIGI